VDHPVVEAAEKDEVVEIGAAALDPMFSVVSIGPAAWHITADGCDSTVTYDERLSLRR
jgi:hypothetical protein